jgi:hypothetical protein
VKLSLIRCAISVCVVAAIGASQAASFPGNSSDTPRSGRNAVPAVPQIKSGGARIAAKSIYNGIVQFSCTGFNASGTGSHVLNRDNTGLLHEALRIDIRDGTGALLFTLAFVAPLGTYSGGMIGPTNYTTPPTANPITFTLTSLAGNGLAEQIDVNVQGACTPVATPAMSSTGLIAMSMLLALAAAGTMLRRRRRS